MDFTKSWISLLALGLATCDSWATCGVSMCSWETVPAPAALSLSMDTTLRIRLTIPGDPDCQYLNEVTAALSPIEDKLGEIEPASTLVFTRYSGCEYTRQITAADRVQAKIDRPGKAFLIRKGEVNPDGSSRYPSIGLTIKKPLKFTSIDNPFSDPPATNNPDTPIRVSVLSDGKIASLQQGAISGRQKRRIKFLELSTDKTRLTLGTQPGYYLNMGMDAANNMFMLPLEGVLPPTGLAALGRIFIAQPYDAPAAYVAADCSVDATDDTKCVYRTMNPPTASDPLPAETKAFSVFDLGGQALLVYLDKQGNLNSALVQPGVNTLAAGWKRTALGHDPQAPHILMAMGKLAADETTLVVISNAQGMGMGPQQISAFAVSSEGGLTPSAHTAKLALSLNEGGNIEALALGPIDEDTQDDLAVARMGKLSFYISDGMGGFALDGFTVPCEQGVSSMAIGQVDGMGGQDLVLAIPAKKQVTVFRNGN